ncbi:hypothetical protein [Microbacterium sp. XT11]|uniref:hypothetical protein n=1 Tax=Microbacterium sp. XT11 TaxID=367477 RepID=UPI00082AD711|nr:hypothetical protein [Microbacterium sp. XT11]
MKLSRKLAVIEKAASGNLLPFPSSPTAVTSGIVSPWSDGELNKFVWSDIYGIEAAKVTRKEALSVPAVAASRHRIVQLADRPLRALNGADDVTTKHPWLYRTDTAVTPWMRLAATLDDWIFYGESLWVLERGSQQEGMRYAPILDALHVPFDRWEVSAAGEILIDKAPVPAESVLYFPGPFEGLLNVAPETIRAAKALERAWSSRVRNPTPTVILEEKEQGTVSKKEATKYVTAVSRALRDPDGAVFFVPHVINLRLESGAGIDVLEGARNAVRIDIANYLNLNASALDGAKPQSSLTYETQQTESQELQDRLAFWTAPLEHRLSMDDVVPRGTRVRFDFATTTPAQTGTPTED